MSPRTRHLILYSVKARSFARTLQIQRLLRTIRLYQVEDSLEKEQDYIRASMHGQCRPTHLQKLCISERVEEREEDLPPARSHPITRKLHCTEAVNILTILHD